MLEYISVVIGPVKKELDWQNFAFSLSVILIYWKNDVSHLCPVIIIIL